MRLWRYGDISNASMTTPDNLQIHIEEGSMTCPNCKHIYPISNGIPNMVCNNTLTVVLSTLDSTVSHVRSLCYRHVFLYESDANRLGFTATRPVRCELVIFLSFSYPVRCSLTYAVLNPSLGSSAHSSPPVRPSVTAQPSRGLALRSPTSQTVGPPPGSPQGTCWTRAVHARRQELLAPASSR